MPALRYKRPLWSIVAQAPALHWKNTTTQDFSCWFAEMGRKGRKSQLCGLLSTGSSPNVMSL